MNLATYVGAMRKNDRIKNIKKENNDSKLNGGNTNGRNKKKEKKFI